MGYNMSVLQVRITLFSASTTWLIISQFVYIPCLHVMWRCGKWEFESQIADGCRQSIYTRVDQKGRGFFGDGQNRTVWKVARYRTVYRYPIMSTSLRRRDATLTDSRLALFRDAAIHAKEHVEKPRLGRLFLSMHWLLRSDDSTGNNDSLHCHPSRQGTLKAYPLLLWTLRQK